MTSADLIAIVITLTILIAVGVYLLHWLYRHSSKDQSFVRTGSAANASSWVVGRWSFRSSTTSRL